MAVYKRNYTVYTGAVTPPWKRVMVLARYAFDEAWSSKITIGLFIFCLLPCIVSLLVIYLANNPIARALVGSRGPQTLAIDAAFFFQVLQTQSWFALFMAAWIAPRLITFDLADNALPILLSHPISRFGYVFGKFIALFGSLSLITWLPSLLLFADEAYSSPQPWAVSNFQIAIGLLAGSVIWIAFLSVLGLALSSWVKWRVVATGVIFAAVFVPAGIGAIFSAVLRTKWGLLLNVPVMMSDLWLRLLGTPDSISEKLSVPTPAIAAMLSLACVLCLLMLNRRIRAREVVRG
jgi:ABC-type transport system involved in multi-copper enzyme maturation permease subunit